MESAAAATFGPWSEAKARILGPNNVLARGFDARAHERLVVTNWLRTAIWTTRGSALLWVLAVTMKARP